MKIVHVALCGPVTDDWSYQENLLTKYHKEIGLDVTMITSDLVWDSAGQKTRSNQSDYINNDGVRIIRLKEKRNNPDYKFRKFPELYNCLKHLNPDILFIHGCQFLDINIIVKYLKQHSGITVYVDNHADFSNSATSWLSKNILHRVIWRYCAKKINPYTSKFYGVLPARVDFLKDMYGLPAEKIELLVMGADDEKVETALKPEINAEIRKTYGISNDNFLIVTGGKIDMAKRQTIYLMEAVNQIEDPKVKLLVFGSVVPELKDAVDKACSEKVQYIGWINSADTDKYYAAAELVVFPGRHSVFWEQVVGLGKPMLVKDWPGTHHIDIGGNVRFLTQDSRDEILEQLIDIIENPNVYEEMKNVAQQKGMKIFSYREIAKRSINFDADKI